MLSDLLLRAVPEAARAGLASGDLAIFGSVIRSATNGQIVYHLQETGALRNLAATALTPGALPSEAVSLASQFLGDAALYRQGQQINAAVNEVAQMQLANLLISGATLGVSIAGFAYLAQRLGKIERQLSRMKDQFAEIRNTMELLREERLHDDLSLLRTMAQQMEESWGLRNPSIQLERVASECHILANRFFDRSCLLLANDRSQLTLAEPLLDAFGIAQSTRLAARLAADELDVSERAAREALGQYEVLLDVTDPAKEMLGQLRRDLKDSSPHSWGEIGVVSYRPFEVAQSLRERASALEGTSHLVSTLREIGISGRELGEIARDEAEIPVLLLQATG